MKPYNLGSKVVVMSVLLFSVSLAFSATPNDFTSAKPGEFFLDILDSCNRGDEKSFFRNYSARKKAYFDTKLDPGERSEYFGAYCDALRLLVKDKLQGDPNNATYTIREKKDPTGRTKHLLCILPPGDERCGYGFDVTIEGGKLKRDEV